jgi:hypothetical protein
MTVFPSGGKRRRASGGLAVCCLLLLAVTGASAANLDKVPGYVDGTKLLELVGDDCVALEVNFSGALIRILTNFDEDLKELAGGLENIHAVILDLTRCGDREASGKLRDEAAGLERDLRRKGWDRVAMIREADASIRVWLLLREDLIDGLVVLITGEDEIVFTNIAGTIDMAKLRELTEGMDIPGFEDIDFDELERERKKKKRNADGE